MFRIYTFMLLFTTAVAFPQEGAYDFNKAEQKTRRLIFSAPEQGLAVIRQTLSQPNLNDTILGKTYNLYGMYYGVTGKPDSLIKYMQQSLGYLRKYPKLKAKALMNLSIGYRNKAELSKAIQIINQALAIYTKNKDNVGIATAYGEMATNYSYMQNYRQAVNYLLKSIALLKAEKNTDKLPAVQQKLANTYIAMGNYAFAIDLNRECAAAFKKAGDTHNYYLTLINLGESLSRTGKYAEANAVLTEALEGLKGYGDKELIGITQAQLGLLKNLEGNRAGALGWYSQAMGNLYAAKSGWTAGLAGEYIELLNKSGKHDDALAVIEKITALKFHTKGNPEGQLKFTEASAETYNTLGRTGEAVDAYQRTLALMDTLNNVKQRGAIQEVQAKYQTEIQREKNLRLQANNNVLKRDVQQARTLLWVYIGAGVVVVVLVLLLLRSSVLKNRLQQEELKSVEAERSLIEQQHLHEQELINAQKEIIGEKQRELTSTALRMANYQDSVRDLIERCDNNDITKVADARRELQNLVRQQDYWKQFETRFNSLHPEFGTSLAKRFDKLTKNDIEFCSLLKLNLSNKEIASLLQISHESVITKKYRIKKKMGITDDEAFERLLMEI
jgi:tetratricopeptide (TPR) repeat protein